MAALWAFHSSTPETPIVASAPALLPAIKVTAPAPLSPKHAARETPPPAVYPLSLKLRVASGDTLSSILGDAGVSNEETQRVVDALAGSYNLRKLDAGDTVAITLDKPAGADAPVISHMTLPISAASSLEIARSKQGFAIRKADAPVERKYARVGGTITSSLYETGIASGIPPALLDELINAYSYDVDFQRDIKEGDAIDVLYERMQTKEGVVTGHGKILFAELHLGDRDLKIYRFVDGQGSGDYYNEKGESIRKALLRTPIPGAHITSGFGMRTHPLLGYSKMHRGVDFGAATGTPIYAAGEGIIEMAGRKGGYGNYLRLRHNRTYESAYAHISRFASGIHPGSHVRQGQVIAYVGSTGLATGPHLHFEILMNGEQVNPANVRFKTGNILAGRELASFRKTVKSINAQMAALPRGKTTLAMAQ